jgi:hypothetical protein
VISAYVELAKADVALQLSRAGAAFAETERGHRAIENNLHWSLDVTLNEDQSRLRTGHGAILAPFKVAFRPKASITPPSARSRPGAERTAVVPDHGP